MVLLEGDWMRRLVSILHTQTKSNPTCRHPKPNLCLGTLGTEITVLIFQCVPMEPVGLYTRNNSPSTPSKALNSILALQSECQQHVRLCVRFTALVRP